MSPVFANIPDFLRASTVLRGIIKSGRQMCLVNSCSVFEGPPYISVCEPQAAASTPHGRKLLSWHKADVGATRNCWGRHREQKFAKPALLPKKLHKIFYPDL